MVEEKHEFLKVDMIKLPWQLNNYRFTIIMKTNLFPPLSAFFYRNKFDWTSDPFLFPAIGLSAHQQFIASQTISITKWYLLTLTWGFKKCLERARDVNYDPVLVTMKQNKPESASFSLPRPAYEYINRPQST